MKDRSREAQAPTYHDVRTEGSIMTADFQDTADSQAIKTISRASPTNLSTLTAELGKTSPQKGPMIVLDIDSDRRCYSRCELDLAEQDLPRVSGAQAHSH